MKGVVKHFFISHVTFLEWDGLTFNKMLFVKLLVGLLPALLIILEC